MTEEITKKTEEEEKSPALADADEQWKEQTAPKPPLEPDPIDIRPKKVVRSNTTEATLVVCQCGKTGFTIAKKTATAISLKCAACGHDVSVKGPVAMTNVDEKEVQAAVLESVISPDPDYKPKGKKKKAAEEDDEEKQEYVNIRFRVTAEMKKNLLDPALAVVRIMNAGSDEYRQQAWQGNALEFIVADFFSGADPEILAHVMEIREELKRFKEEQEKTGIKKSALARKLRDKDQALRDKTAVELGIIKPAEKKVKPPKVKEEADDDERIRDNDRLVSCVKSALIDAAEKYRERAGETLGMLIGVSMNDALKRANKDGGFVIEIRGDERTRDAVNARPSIVVWIEKEVDEFLELELQVDYSDEYEIELPTATLAAVEIIPKENVTWEMPTFCTEREER